MANDMKLSIEQAWISRARAQGLKASTLTYKRAEIEFFSGAMAAIHAADAEAEPDKLSRSVPPIWIINAFSGRPIVDLKKGTE